MKQKDGRYRTVSTQAAIRKQVIDYLKRKLGTQGKAAEIFGLHIRSVSRVWTKYNTGGIESIQQKKRGAQKGKKISEKQADEVRRLIKDKLPDQLKLPFGLWTREALRQLLKKRYTIAVSRWQAGRYLKNWGYTPQKPIHKTLEPKPEKIKQWLKKEYPAIKKRAREENSILYFGDETVIRNNPAPAGDSAAIKKTGERSSLNMISAISNRSHLQFMIIAGRVSGEIFQTYLEQMIKHSKQKIFFIIEGHPAFKNKKLNEWLAQHTRRIEVFFLPPYSSKLNSQE